MTFKTPRGGRVAPAPAALAIAAMLALSFGVAQAADDAALTAFSTAAVGDAPAAWKFTTLPNKTATKYSIVELGGAKVLKAEATDSYGNLVHGVRLPVSDKTSVTWRWRVDQLVEGADIRNRAGDDASAKLCFFFAFDAAKLPFGERTRLALAHSATGQDVPTETLCYVWDNKVPVDTQLVNAFTRRIRFIVLQSGEAKLGQWVPQQRTLAADYLRAFADEAEGKVPDLVGVAVSADADNTHAHGLAYFGDITLMP